ncbi:Capsule assembly protein Wzi [Algoriphagus faecimaris]|uniref:Capsule assembly protein Wzi n=1 Tax=Algoriphagus faecimaris TaxID=686796 RepID=A0A1G6PWA1_9BACT|nr:capsule assembly Wzi family protein [Algoriphagus faecimaris]SDC84261.1 Capsule assembly protein Wzi [Algoriphagus faecimaris]
MEKRFLFFLVLMVFWAANNSSAQSLNAGFPVVEEYTRRAQLLGNSGQQSSFFIRPFDLKGIYKDQEDSLVLSFFPELIRKKGYSFGILPAINSTSFNSKRPYGWGNKGKLPNVGLQSYFSGGFFAKLFFLKIQFQPEFVFASNNPFEGFSDNFSNRVTRARFFYWNNGDNPERFGNEPISRFWWGQSSLALEFGPMDLSLSTANIWWGPGQFNSLTFSDNAEGFPHFSLKTNRPLKTFIGNVETEIIVGRLENSQIAPSQSDSLNRALFRRFDGDWRYLNAIHLSYNPSFLKNFFVGFSRTFQQYNQFRGNTFNDWFPIFEVFQKKTLFTNGNSVEYDSRGQDQQVVLSFRYFSNKGNFEVYSEYGRRDHAFDWRDFIMNPEHARAYLMGFQKLFQLEKPDQFIQVRGELTHQQESVNRYIRYSGLIGNQTWHTHGLARGFVNRGEALGVGAGVGSNVQTLEISKVRKMNKIGVLFERLENHQDFYYRAFGQNSEKKPWIDFSLGLLWDHQWQNLLISAKGQFIRSSNYQWESASLSSQDFSAGEGKIAFFGQLHLIYAIKKN